MYTPAPSNDDLHALNYSDSSPLPLDVQNVDNYFGDPPDNSETDSVSQDADGEAEDNRVLWGGDVSQVDVHQQLPSQHQIEEQTQRVDSNGQTVQCKERILDRIDQLRQLSAKMTFGLSELAELVNLHWQPEEQLNARLADFSRCEPRMRQQDEDRHSAWRVVPPRRRMTEPPESLLLDVPSLILPSDARASTSGSFSKPQSGLFDVPSGRLRFRYGCRIVWSIQGPLSVR
ncbi:hypothetical protein BV20DRAFT_982734 [Pilatotrama ljubarskyi]|nr:hypothetical protein BV20DRAFT_982734 [Pilatotrama ljubarskyi]